MQNGNASLILVFKWGIKIVADHNYTIITDPIQKKKSLQKTDNRNSSIHIPVDSEVSGLIKC